MLKIKDSVDLSHKHNSIIIVYDGGLWTEELLEEDIKSIVTKEQFSSLEYII